MIGQLGNYKSILLLLILLLFPVINLWNLPLSEDTGFYAYLSRAVMHGATLHNDIPVSTNSLAIFFNLDQSNFFVKIVGILLHPIQLLIELCNRSSSCINAKCIIPDDLKSKS